MKRITINFATYASKGNGVDSETTEIGTMHNLQALQSKATRKHGVQRRFGDADPFKTELLKLREVNRLGCDVREPAISNGGNTEGFREAEGSRW